MSVAMLLAGAAAVFIGLSSQSLPATVATHFGAGGVADGFMSRKTYLGFMLLFSSGLPLMLAALPQVLFGWGKLQPDLPQRAYWLAPERRAATVAFLGQHSARFGGALALFIGYVHWLILRAHAAAPPRLSSLLFVLGLLAFGVFALIWLLVWRRRFQTNIEPGESAHVQH